MVLSEPGPHQWDRLPFALKGQQPKVLAGDRMIFPYAINRPSGTSRRGPDRTPTSQYLVTAHAAGQHPVNPCSPSRVEKKTIRLPSGDQIGEHRRAGWTVQSGSRAPRQIRYPYIVVPARVLAIEGDALLIRRQGDVVVETRLVHSTESLPARSNQTNCVTPASTD